MQAVSKPSAENGISLILLSFCFSVLAEMCGTKVMIPQKQKELEIEAVLRVLACVLPKGWKAEKGKSLPEKQQ